MRKKYAIFTVIIFILLVTTFTYFNTLKQNNIYKENIENNQTKITKGISMNLEQTAGAGDYKTVTQSGWPTEGYKFNTELSRCENGSELSWDDTNKKVIVSGNLSDKCYVYFDIWIPTIADYCTSGTDLATCVKNFGDQGVDVSNIYIHDSSLTNGAGDNSYRFAGGDYNLTKKAKKDGRNSIIGGNNPVVQTLDVDLSDWEDVYNSTYYVYYDNIRYFNTFAKALTYAINDGYLEKDNVKNFVCFGSNEKPCPYDNLYRIIGVFDDKVKLIKSTFITCDILGINNCTSYGQFISDNWRNDFGYSNLKYYPDHWSRGTNTWSESYINTEYLNTRLINNLGTIWSNKIATTTWKVGGNTAANIRSKTPSEAYTNEITSPTKNTTYSAKIGLMYVSDYGYSVQKNYWGEILFNYNGISIDGPLRLLNWMYMGATEWTISPDTTATYDVFAIYYDGRITSQTVDDLSFNFRPVFFLNSSVSYVSGTGTQSDPIRIN